MTAIQNVPGGVKAVRLRCRSWSCPVCNTRRRKRLMHEAAKGRPNKLLTITAAPGQFNTKHEAARALSLGWRRCRQQLKRHHGHLQIEAMAIFEEHKSGWPHLHILVRSNFIPQKWLSKYFGDRIGSPVVDIRKIRSSKMAINYVAKYIGKAPGRFRGTKRYWRTANYLTPKRKREPASEQWKVLYSSLERFLFRCGHHPSPNVPFAEDQAIVSGVPP